MADPNFFDPHPREFDRFLYAPVGVDRNGYVVTVLSTLARLGLDPWSETEKLVKLGRDAAGARLGTLLARDKEVPALAGDHDRIAQDLSLLLPEGRRSRSPVEGVRAAASNKTHMNVTIMTILAVIFLVFQIMAFGGPGAGG